MIAVALLGIAAGAGTIGIVAGLRVKTRSLSAGLAALESPAREVSSSTDVPAPTALVRGRRELRRVSRNLADRVGSVFPRAMAVVERDLVITDRGLDELAEGCVLGAIVGASVPLGLWALLVTAGVGVPLVVPAWVALLGASCGAVVPCVSLHEAARTQRQVAYRAVGCFLDLVVLALAGGLGIEGALHAAASTCHTRVTNRIASSLDEARDAGRTPWEALAETGRRIGVDELVELSAAVSLAGTEGARIRSTLSAKAQSMRQHQLADAESEANRITERLFLPGVFLLLGFMIFIGYPAISRLSSGI